MTAEARVRVDPVAVAGLAALWAATAAELSRIVVAAQAVAVHPALALVASRSPMPVARAVGHLERALLGRNGLAAMPMAYTRLAADAAAQVTALAAAEAAAPNLRALDLAGGLLAGAALHHAGLTVPMGRRALDGWIPEGPGVTVAVPTPSGAGLPRQPSIAALYARVGTLGPGEVEVTPVTGADGVVRYLVLLRGVEPGLNSTVNTPWQAVKSSGRRTDAYSRAAGDALRRAGVPAGAELLLVGHSQGGIAAMNLAGDAAPNAPGGRYRVTHVVAAGSPIANKRVGPGTRVLSVEHQGDLIPELDGVEEHSTGRRAIYRFGGDRRASMATAHHGIGSGYLPELAGARFGADPAVRGYLLSAAPYLLGQPGAPRRFRLDAGPYAEPDAVQLVRRVLRSPCFPLRR